MDNNYLVIDEESIKNKIYEIRGKHVMIDSDLARIYGYSTKDFNRQVKNNIERFDDDFMFQLTSVEIEELSRCKNFTLNKVSGRGHNIKYMPYIFIKQGMKDYIINTGSLLSYNRLVNLTLQVENHIQEINKINDKSVYVQIVNEIVNNDELVLL